MKAADEDIPAQGSKLLVRRPSGAGCALPVIWNGEETAEA
jgi:hypothetical protein